MSTSVFLAILVTSLATFSSRFLGAISSQGIKETSKLFKWFNCLAYSTLAALIARTIIFPVGVLSDASYLSRVTVVLFCLFIFFISKRNFVYPTVISAIMMALLSNYQLHIQLHRPYHQVVCIFQVQLIFHVHEDLINL